MSRATTFMEEVLAGRALAHDAEDWVDAWHDAPDSDPIAQMSLPEYLGMTDEEYARWVERPEALRFIITARKTHQAPASVELLDDVIAAAARAENDAEAADVIRWLQQTGRL